MKQKQTNLLMILLFISSYTYSQIQYDYALKIQQMAKDLYWVESLTEYIEEEELYQNIKLEYDESLNKVANEKAKLYLDYTTEELENKTTNDSTNFFVFKPGDNPEDEEYLQFLVEDASRSWARIEFNSEKYVDYENQCIERNDLSNLWKILKHTKVGFGYAISKDKLIIVSYYN